ncbi:MAG: DNA recombination protein RmuC [Planctomycetes bacterium]|nr:DNA recombination protein RmuC [Planctomycetota bacterium]
MSDVLAVLAIVLVAVVAILQIVLLRRRPGVDLSPLEPFFTAAEKAQERGERAVREEVGRNRGEAAELARQAREELAGQLKNVADTLNKQLANLTQTNVQKLDAVRDTMEQRLQRVQTDGGQRLEAMRTTLDEKLKAIQQDNTAKLEQMRQTVDEKLQGTLEKRLGESFKLVSERLEQVSKGLGEMQALATGVGDLKRVLTNVKTRGTWGEVQLAALLEEVLTPDQYATNVATKEGSSERVEFAIKLPGRGDDADQTVWLPIDAKFPIEDYQRLTDAQDRADPDAAEVAARALEGRIKGCAGDIRDKYLDPPRTTDFGILFLPTEGLFAEVVRRPGLADTLQREYRVVIAGPTTLWSILGSLQLGFRTLAIQKRSSEVWKLLAAVKTEFGRYGEILGKVQKKLQEASNTVDSAAVRTRAIERKLRDVQELPATEAQSMLALGSDEAIETNEE